MLSADVRLAFMRVLKCLAAYTVTVGFDKTNNCWMLVGSEMRIMVNDDTGYCTWHHMPVGYAPDQWSEAPIADLADAIIACVETKRPSGSLTPRWMRDAS